jgi:hypothetical protein
MGNALSFPIEPRAAGVGSGIRMIKLVSNKSAEMNRDCFIHSLNILNWREATSFAQILEAI